MSAYVADEITALAHAEEGPESVNLLIGVREGHLTEVQHQARKFGATDVEELPFSSLHASVPRSSIVEICGLDGIESVELDEGMEILEGN
ncbi:hypothetical protein [Halovenus halobia]|uniref:hypothetical protein n=1 Tax=Halovenus halobia TaxID=3396622 RepID=UPI003F579328